MKDITTVRDFIERFPKKDICFIFDRGFSSYGLLNDLGGAPEESKTDVFIIP